MQRGSSLVTGCWEPFHEATGASTSLTPFVGVSVRQSAFAFEFSNLELLSKIEPPGSVRRLCKVFFARQFGRQIS